MATRRHLLRSLGFVLCAAALHAGWALLHGSALARWVIEGATVHSAVALINTLTPQAAAWAQGASIRSPQHTLNILNGCEGTEVLVLLWAALLVAPLRARVRGVALPLAALWVFAINQLRLLALFYALRFDGAWFAALHGVVTPLAMVLGALLFMLAVLHVNASPSLGPAAPQP